MFEGRGGRCLQKSGVGRLRSTDSREQQRRRDMVAAVRRGQSLRSVASEFNVSLNTVRHWVERAGDQRLDRVDWSTRQPGPSKALNRTSNEVETAVLQIRRELKGSDLGEWGAEAIRHELQERAQAGPGLLSGHPIPCARTIHRILERHGVLDAQQRRRQSPPPRGWYLPDVSAGRAELDQCDVVSGLTLRGGPELQILTAISLHGGWIDAWPLVSVTSLSVRHSLTERWQRWGLPAYAQFDNDTRFQGGHCFPNTISSVVRFCLSLGVTPVFAPPRETGFRAAIESLNGRWQAKVWSRHQHASLPALQAQSQRYVNAAHHRHRQRAESAPVRRTFPVDWTLDLQRDPTTYMPGCVIFLRRTDDSGAIRLLERRFVIDANWQHRLVRAELHLPHDCIRVYKLRRREPTHQPLLAEVPYVWPKNKKRFHHLKNK